MDFTRRQLLTALAAPPLGRAAPAPPIVRPQLPGMVWQPSNRTLRPRGRWHQLGIQRLLVQWTAVDSLSFIPGTGLKAVGPTLPDWSRIAAEPWAQEVTLGLAGRYDEKRARASLRTLAAQSSALVAACAKLPLRVSSYYFPVEFDPTWAPPSNLRSILEALPRPLWVSVYDNANRGPKALVEWIKRWVPPHVGVYFQDGVGVHSRVPKVAREYLRVLTDQLGPARVQVIAEAFRPTTKGAFRSATARELLPQLDAYQGWPIFVFDGPHYLRSGLVAELKAAGVGATPPERPASAAVPVGTPRRAAS